MKAAVVLLVVAVPQQRTVVTATNYQGGSCYTDYGWTVSTCSDVSTYCSSSQCSSTNGELTYSCTMPHTCSGRVSRTAPPTVSPSPTQSQAPSSPSVYNGLEQSGSCHTTFQVSIGSCNNLSQYCSSSSCSSTNSVIQYSCTSPFTCSGRAGPVTPAPTPWSPELADCINGRKLSLTTCGDASGFSTIGCSCYTCNELNGDISLKCTAPFQCSNTLTSGTTAEPAPKLETKDYAIIISIYLVITGLVGLIAWGTNPQKSAPKTKMQIAMDATKSALFNMFVKPNFRPDGSTSTLLEFWASQNPWVALCVRCVGCISSSSSQARMSIQPKGTGRSLLEILVKLLVMLSLAFLFGTVVSNSENCSSSVNANYCSSGGGSIVINSQVTTSTSSLSCDSLETSVTNVAKALTTVLTKSVGWSCDYAEGTAGASKSRAKAMVVLRVIATGALFVFGMVYSFNITREAANGDKDAAVRRLRLIVSVFVASWLVDEATSAIYQLAQRIGIVFASCLKPADNSTSKADLPSGPVVHPVVASNRTMDDAIQSSSVVLQVPSDRGKRIGELVAATD